MFTRGRSNSLSAITDTKERHADPNTCTQETPSTQNSGNSPSSQNEWQVDRVPQNSQKRKDISPIDSGKQKLVKNVSKYGIPTQNRFDILQNEDTDQIEKEYIPKPEPIFITGVLDIKALKEILNKLVEANLYTLKTLKSGHVIKLMPNDIATYKIIRENFTSNNIAHYTYQLKSERAYRAVLRGLHSTEDTNVTKEELKSQGHVVRQIVNVFHKITKKPLPLFFVDLEPKSNNKDIFQVKYLNQMRVTFEAPYKKKEIIQCKRCQRFGHSKNQCCRPHRCVKCGGDHPTNSCSKTPETEPTCANCQEKHPANYKGCIKYKQFKEKIVKSKPSNKKVNTEAIKKDRVEENAGNLPSKIQSSQKSYASVAATTKTTTEDISSTQLTEILDKMFVKLQQVMVNMMDKMMDRMIQLITGLATKASPICV